MILLPFFMKPHYHVTVRAMIMFRFGRRQVRHDIGWFDKDESAVGILTSRLESEASTVRIQRTLSKYKELSPQTILLKTGGSPLRLFKTCPSWPLSLAHIIEA